VARPKLVSSASREGSVVTWMAARAALMESALPDPMGVGTLSECFLPAVRTVVARFVIEGVVIRLPLVLVGGRSSGSGANPEDGASTLLPAHPVRSVVSCARQVSWLTARSRSVVFPGARAPSD
jgi:hypothetical protein